MRAYSPGGILNALAYSAEPLTSPTPSIHRLRRGLPGYLILFAPHAFEPQRQYQASGSPSQLVFLPISTHSTATPGIPSTSPIFKKPSFRTQVQSWALKLNIRLKLPPTLSLRPVIPNNTCPPRITAAAGTKLAGASFAGTFKSAQGGPYSLPTVVYTPKCFIPRMALLRQGFPHCAKFPTAASRRSLGRISVPMWPFTLSGRLPIKALVGRYPTNWLMGRKLIQGWRKRLSLSSHAKKQHYSVLVRR